MPTKKTSSFIQKITRSGWEFFRYTVVPRMRQISTFEFYVFMLVAMGIFFVFLFFKKQDQYSLIRVELAAKDWVANGGTYGYKIPYWLSEKIEVGLAEKNAYGSKIAEVMSVENYLRGNEEAQIYLVVKVKTKYDEKTEQHIYKNFPIQVGAPIEFDFPGAKVPGQIIDDNFPTQGYEQKEFIAVGHVRGVEEWLAKQIVPGQAMIERSTGKKAMEVLEVRLKPIVSKVSSKIEDDRLIFRNPEVQLYDVEMKVKFLAQKIDNRWYVAGNQGIRIGSELWLHTDQLTIAPFIVESLESPEIVK